MNIFGIDIVRRKKELQPVTEPGGLWRRVHEPFTGAWQRNIDEEHGTLLCYPALYGCLNRISTDIGKLRFMVVKEDANGISTEVKDAQFPAVLDKPNHYQTEQQFRESWMLSKLIQGNTYVLKGRDKNGNVIALYILDPTRVQPMISDSGIVFYKLLRDRLNGVGAAGTEQEIVVPADEIIHDRCITLHHWLIGVPPLCAAYWPTLKNLKILKSSAEFFGNNAQPGGILTAPAGLSETDAAKLQSYWQTNYTGELSGRVAVIGADMKFTSFAMKSADSQLVEQMKYSDEQICQPFGIPPFIVGLGTIPAGLKVDDMTNMYYSFALQAHIESMEALLDIGLTIKDPMYVELDLEPLLRMDVAKRADVEVKLVGGKIKTPDEGRKAFNLSRTGGGNTLWGQQQDFPLAVLADRGPPTDGAAPAPAPPDEPTPEPDAPSSEQQATNQARLFAALTRMEIVSHAVQ